MTGKIGGGVKSGGGGGRGMMVMRAVSDVYPPPGTGMATEVYPRDPDAAVLWKRNGAINGEGAGEGEGMDIDTPGRG